MSIKFKGGHFVLVIFLTAVPESTTWGSASLPKGEYLRVSETSKMVPLLSAMLHH